MTNTKLLGFVAIAFLAGTITSGTIAFADTNQKSPLDTIVTAINNLTTAINNKQTTVTVNAPAGPAGPAGPTGATGPAGPQGPTGPAPNLQVTEVKNSITIAPNTVGEVTATCPSGAQATGGGYQQYGQIDVTASTGVSQLGVIDAWQVAGFNSGTIPEYINAYAYCTTVTP